MLAYFKCSMRKKITSKWKLITKRHIIDPSCGMMKHSTLLKAIFTHYPIPKIPCSLYLDTYHFFKGKKKKKLRASVGLYIVFDTCERLI